MGIGVVSKMTLANKKGSISTLDNLTKYVEICIMVGNKVKIIKPSFLRTDIFPLGSFVYYDDKTNEIQLLKGITDENKEDINNLIIYFDNKEKDYKERIAKGENGIQRGYFWLNMMNNAINQNKKKLLESGKSK